MKPSGMPSHGQKPQKPLFILVDVYETLLDMSEVEKKMNYLMASKRGYVLWFELFMQYCFVDNCIEQFNDFSSVAKATMQMAARVFGREISDGDFEDVLTLLKHLPIHPGVQEGLSQLNDRGFGIAALTNSPQQTVIERMERTGLISYFKRVLSAEHVKKYKPALEVYQWAMQQMGVSPKEVLLVSAHGWDLAGAVNAGMQTAYIQQPRQMLYPLAPKPDYTCKNLADLAVQLEEYKVN